MPNRETTPSPFVPRSRKVRILATLGPASDTPEMIRELAIAGADAFRINMSHGNHEDHARRIAAIRGLESELDRPTTILADLQGPKLRLGTFAAGKATLVAGARFGLDLDEAPGDAARAPLPHPEIFAALRPGTEVLLDDGRVRLRVDSNGSEHAETTVLVGGEISNRKGVNLPRVPLPKEAWYPPRQRWRAEKLLAFLGPRLPADGLRILGLTAADISTTKGKVVDWGVLGLGALDGSASVISTFRCHKKARDDTHARA